MFPNDATTTAISIISNTTVLPATTSILQSGDKTILGFTITNNASTFVQLWCDGQYLYDQVVKASPIYPTYLQSECQGNLELIQGTGSATAKTHIEVTYVPRLISTTNAMATDTPFLTQEFYSEGSKFISNPLATLTGILELSLVFVLVVMGIMRFMKKV